MAGFLFNEGAYGLQKGTIHWDADTIKARLVPSAAGALDIDADVMTGIGSAEATATITLDTPVGPTKDDAADHVKYTSADADFPGAAAAIGACNRMVIFKFVSDDSDSIPIAAIDISAITPFGTGAAVTMPTLGWFYTQQHA